jgi:hypothetical protein
MSVTVKLLGFLVALAAVFGGAVGIGRAVGPVGSPVAAHDEMDGMDGTQGEGMEGMEGMDMPSATDIPKGLMVSQDGYSFRLATTTASAGRGVPVSFTIEGPDGEPVTQYDVEHDEDLHLIAVRRDFSGFQHVHPEMAPDGTWTTELDLTPGAWRLFADFKATGADAATTSPCPAGSSRPKPLPLTPGRARSTDTPSPSTGSSPPARRRSSP